MRLIDKEEFLRLPAGTIFATYRPHYTEDLAIKGGTYGDKYGNYNYCDLVGVSGINTDDRPGEEGCTATMDTMTEGSFHMDNEAYGRAMPSPEDKYIVYEQRDLDQLIQRLQEAVPYVPAK